MKYLKKYKLFENTSNYEDDKKIIREAVTENDIDTIKEVLYRNKSLVNDYYIYDVNMKETLLIIAARFSRWDIMKILIDNGADINLQDGDGNSALHSTIYNNCIKCVNILIDAGININLQNDDGDTPLIKAVYRLEDYNSYGLDMIELLINNGSDWNMKNNDENLTFIEKLEKISIRGGNEYKFMTLDRYIKNEYSVKYKDYLEVIEINKNTQKYGI